MTSVAPPEPITPHAPPLAGPVLMNQDWRDLAFLHWAVPPERVAPLLPRGVRPDVHEGLTYVGLVPFRMADAGLGRGRPVPWLGSFLETNVRLYSVDGTGRRGVVFLSLDCERVAVVAAARAGLGLPYRWARLRHRAGGPAGAQRHEYDARLRRRPAPRRSGPPVTSRVVLEVGGVRRPTALDHFLTARWGLHTRHAGRTHYLPNVHEPWTLHDVTVRELADGLLAVAGFGDLAGRPPDHTAYSPGVHTEFGLPVPATRPRSRAAAPIA